MSSWAGKRILIAVLVAVAGGVGFAVVPASADGPCGSNSDASTACAVTPPGTYHGLLSTAGEDDFYRLDTKAPVYLSVTVQDDEDPSCSQSLTCGSVQVGIGCSSAGIDSCQWGSNSTTPGNPTAGASSNVRAGVSYVVVEGSLGTDANGNPRAIPYSLTVKASRAFTLGWVCTHSRVRRHHHWLRVRHCHWGKKFIG